MKMDLPRELKMTLKSFEGVSQENVDGCKAQCFSQNSQWEPAHSPRAEFDSVLGQLPPIFKFRQQDNTSFVKLQFSVPFFKIPIKTTTRRTSEILKELRDINGQWVYSAVTVFTGIGLALGLFHSKHTIIDAAKDFLNNINFFGGHRNGRYELSAIDLLVYIVRNRDNIKFTHCMQKLICHLVRQSSRKVSRGSGSNMNKVIDGFASNRFLLTHLSGMEMKSFIENGKNGRSCSSSVQFCGKLDNYFMQLAYKI